MTLNAKSLERLTGVHPDLVKVIKKAAEITDTQFIVTEGLRTLARQKQLLAAGATRTLKSRHITGHAVDLAVVVDGEVRWDWPLYKKLSENVKKAAASVGIPIEWGGDWRTFKDGPHYQLPFKLYPEGKK